MLLMEKEIMEFSYNTKITSFSWHNPTTALTKINDFRVCGMINVYSDVVKNNFQYSSYSSGYWRFDRMQNVVNQINGNNIHLLTHGVWWTKEVLSPRKKIISAIEGRKNSSIKKYDDSCEFFLDRYNIDDDSIDKELNFSTGRFYNK